MMKYIRIMLIILVTVSLCRAEETLRVGAVFSKSGDATAISVEHLITVRFAVDEINAAGGVLGKQLELLEFDNESTALGSRKAARKAIKEKVSAVIGASWSSHALGMAPEFQKAGIPMITPTATHPDVTGVGDYIFRVCFIDSFQAEMIAQFVHDDLKAGSVAVLTNTDQVYSMGLSRQFISRLEQYGKTVAVQFDYVETSLSFNALVDELTSVSADVIFLPGYTRDSAQIIKAARSKGIDAMFVGGDGWSHLMYNYAFEELNNTYFLTHWHKAMDDKKSRVFMKKITGLFDDSKINAGMALSYDAVYLLADALKRAGDSDSRKLRDALARTRMFEGVTGTIRFDADRNPVKQAVILKFQDGETQVVKRVFPPAGR